MQTVNSSLFSAAAINLDNSLLQTLIPLFDDAKIEAVEWSFDTLFTKQHVPDWFHELLQTFSKKGRLIGHGVFFSMFSGKWTIDQERWLKHLRQISRQFKFDHISEHFGFMTGENFHKGAPISVPFTPATLALGIDRIKRIQEACSCPVGIENLAFSYSPDEVKRHGEFLEKLVDPVNGFIILDLHNFYCQLQNFSLPFETLIQAYPLDRVREIHISGGSWEPSDILPTRSIRRDTHDDAVPKAVFDLLQQTMPLCPNLKFVVLEQLGTALHDAISQQQFRIDFETMQHFVNLFQADRKTSLVNSFLPVDKNRISTHVPEDSELYKQQMELSNILEIAQNESEARHLLSQSCLQNSAWQTEKWSPYMLETALKIAQKWKNGW